MQQLSAKLSDLEARQIRDETRLSSLEPRISFRAEFSPSTLTPPSGPFKFDHVVINDGSGYDPILGVFTAPVSGLYLFSCQYYTQSGSQKPQVDIRVNGNMIARMSGAATADAYSDMTSSTARLSQGDRVWMEGTSTTGEGNFWGPGHTFFFGALLYTA